MATRTRTNCRYCNRSFKWESSRQEHEQLRCPAAGSPAYESARERRLADIEELATYNPRHALEGWAAGYRAEGNEAEAARMEAALELQERRRALAVTPDAHVPGQAIDLGNARSYFSPEFEDKLADELELGRQLQAHSMEAAYVLDAIRELGAFARFKAQARRQSKAARTLAGATILELVWGAGGKLDYGKVILEAQRRHRRAGSRTRRVFEALERDGVIRTDRPSLRGDEPLWVRLVGVVDSQEVEQARAKVDELERIDREDEAAHRAAVRTGDAALAGRTASSWSSTRGELITAQRELKALTHPVFSALSPEARLTIARNAS